MAAIATKAPVKVSIDPEFAKLLPTQTEEELATLENLLLEEGCTDPVCYWDAPGNLVLDGMTRYVACKKNDIPFKVRPIKLADRDAAIEWILRHQLGRRNLNDVQRSLLRGDLYNRSKGQQGGDHKSEAFRKSRGQNVPLIGTGKTEENGAVAAKIAAADGVTEKTVKRDGEFKEATDAVVEKAPELRDDIERGTIPKSAVPALAEAPKSELKKLEKLEGAELKAAAREVAEEQKAKPKRNRPSANGKPASSKAPFKEVIGLLGKALNRIDSINTACPHGNLHRKALGEVKVAMRTVEEWQRTARL